MRTAVLWLMLSLAAVAAGAECGGERCTCTGCTCNAADVCSCNECRCDACEEPEGTLVKLHNPWDFAMKVCIGPDVEVRGDRECLDAEWITVPPGTTDVVRMPECTYTGQDVYPCVWHPMPNVYTPVHVLAVDEDGNTHSCQCYNQGTMGARGPCAVSPEFKDNVIELRGASCPSPPMKYQCTLFYFGQYFCTPSPTMSRIREYCPAEPQQCASDPNHPYESLVTARSATRNPCEQRCIDSMLSCTTTCHENPSCTAHCLTTADACTNACVVTHPAVVATQARLHQRCCNVKESPACKIYPVCGDGLVCVYDVEIFGHWGTCQELAEERPLAQEGERCCNTNIHGPDGQPLCRIFAACGEGLYCHTGEMTSIPGFCVKRRGYPAAESLCLRDCEADYGSCEERCRLSFNSAFLNSEDCTAWCRSQQDLCSLRCSKATATVSGY